jgi:hypothetical protein
MLASTVSMRTARRADITQSDFRTGNWKALSLELHTFVYAVFFGFRILMIVPDKQIYFLRKLSFVLPSNKCKDFCRIAALLRHQDFIWWDCIRIAGCYLLRTEKCVHIHRGLVSFVPSSSTPFLHFLYYFHVFISCEALCYKSERRGFDSR